MTGSRRQQRTAEWDAAEYHRLANPHITWGRRVLAELPLTGDEMVIDAGCGSGRLTAELLERLPDGCVFAIDISQNMLDEAARYLEPRFGERVSFIKADLQNLSLGIEVDAVFSTAAFHWVLDHQRLFRALFQVLKPGGWLVAQCGGGPNIATVLDRAAGLMRSPPYAGYFANWTGPWEFADDRTTAGRLRAAGFVDVETSLEASLVTLASRQEYHDYLATIVFGTHLARLPDAHLRNAFIETLAGQAASDDPPYMLDYWRLNIKARRPE